MSKFKNFLAAFTALCAMASVVGTASASRTIQLSQAGNISAESLGLLSFNMSTAFGDVTMTCLFTLAGSLSGDSFAKVPGTQFGQLTNGIVGNPCNDTVMPIFGPSVTSIVTLFATGSPRMWALTYSSFLGELPSPTGILIAVNNFQFGFTMPNIGTCLYQGNVPALLQFNGGSPNLSQIIEILRHSVGLVSGDVLCSAAIELVGTFALDPQQELMLGG